MIPKKKSMIPLKKGTTHRLHDSTFFLASVAVRIGKKPLTITGVTAASKPYDGTTNADISSVTFDNVTSVSYTHLLADVTGNYTINGTQDTGLDLNGHSIKGTVTVKTAAGLSLIHI